MKRQLLKIRPTTRVKMQLSAKYIIASSILFGFLSLSVFLYLNVGSSLDTKANGNKPFTIELTSFMAMPIAEGVELTWSTVREETPLVFTLETSQDSINFYPLQILKSVGSPESGFSYRVVDKSASGLTYYRIRFNNVNGQTAISKPIVVKGKSSFLDASHASVLENLLIEPTQAVNISLVDQSGNILMEKIVIPWGTPVEMELPPMKKGLYLLKMEGGTSQQQKNIAFRGSAVR